MENKVSAILEGNLFPCLGLREKIYYPALAPIPKDVSMVKTPETARGREGNGQL
jgi:hypothetical protein